VGEPLRNAESPVKPDRRRHRHWFTSAPVVLVASFLLLVGLAEAVPRTVRAEVASSLGLSAGTLFDPPAPPKSTIC
jgi:hypothetical protein